MFEFYNLDLKVAPYKMSKHDANTFCSENGSFVVSPDRCLSVGGTLESGVYWTEYNSFRLQTFNKGIT